MIDKIIKNLLMGQQEEYMTRYDILDNVLTEEELHTIEDKELLPMKLLKKVRQYVIGLEGDDNNASFEEGMVVSLEDAQRSIKEGIKRHIKNLISHNDLSKDFILGMEEINNLIK